MVDTWQSLEEVREAGDQLEQRTRAIWSLSAHSTSFCARTPFLETHNSLLSLNLFNLSNIFFQRQAETLSLLPLLSLSLFLVDKANLLRWYINTVFSDAIISVIPIN